GYFDEAAAQREAARLKAQGLEVSVYGVPAYSTLGWLNWAGGDPLLNTFIESYATAVELMGSARWLSERASPAAREQYARFEMRRRQFRALTTATRRQLILIYEGNKSTAVDQSAMLALKNRAMQEFRDSYARLKASWGGYAGYDHWVAGANNASFGALAFYDELVPQFEALFAREGNSWPRFYDAVKQLAKLPKDERIKALDRQAGSLHQEANGG